ncbi:MAG: HAMP domain-containing histidine kinase [Rubrivivax sp.]|nr:HAMP domain-containing histidine kinase [Rubrivivax sp.]
MKALPTIRSRLTGLLVAVALAWGLGVSAAVWLAVTSEVDELLDETLQAAAPVLGRLLSLADGADLTEAAAAIGEGAGQHEHFAWQLVGPGGLLLRSARAPAQPWLPLPVTGFADAAAGWRVYALPLADGRRTLYVAQTRDERREAAAEIAWAAVWSALAIALLSAWWLQRRVRRELQPLDDLALALARYEPLPPATALAAPTRRELQPVHDAIEALGERLARRVANERAFSAHSAHALRTPLAGIDLQLAVAEREAPPALQPRLARAREAVTRLTRVVAALLALFRSGAELQRRPIHLASLLARLPHEPLQLQVGADDVVDADEDLLSAALINLLDNAVRHGAGTLQVTWQARDGLQRLRLHDDGRGAPPERRAELARALADQAYEGRMGLGLMLADLVARAHGGELTLPEVAQGFAAELSLAPDPSAATPAVPT